MAAGERKVAFDTSNDYTEFSGIDSGLQNNTVAGRLEIEGSGEGFRYEKTIIENLPSQTKTFRDDWWIELRDGEGEGAEVKFRQRVNFGLHVLATGDGGPLPIFIARPTEDEQISTTIINGTEIDPKTAVDYLDLGYQSEFGITSDFSANPGADGGGVVTGTWRSPFYRQDVAEGDFFHILHDGWRPIGLSRIATYRTSYKAGVPHFDALYDDVRAHRIAQIKGGVSMAHSYGDLPGLLKRARISGAREPSVWKDPTNRLWLAASHENQFKLWFSPDDGRSLRPKRTVDKDKKETDLVIFDAKYRYPRVKRLASGTVLAVALRGGRICIARSPDGQDWSTPIRVVAAARHIVPYWVVEDPGSGVAKLSNGTDHELVSRSDGRDWK